MSSSNHHHYDQNLLNAAPVATRAQRQQGYNVDLLNQSRPLRSEKVTPTVLTPRGTDVETAVHEKYGTIGASHTPFFQSTKGRIAIFIAAIVIIGAVVGGAVGGSKKHSGSHNSSTSLSPEGDKTASSISSSITLASSSSQGESATTSISNSTAKSSPGSHSGSKTIPLSTTVAPSQGNATTNSLSITDTPVSGNPVDSPSTTPPSNIRRR